MTSEPVALHTQTIGDGPRRVVLVHGAMDRHHSFRRVARRLHDHTAVLYDRRGYAGSRALVPADGIERHVADLVALLDTLGSEPAVVVGHSMGGLIALTTAAHFPDRIRSVGAFEAPTGWRPWWPDELCVLADESPTETVERFFRQMVGGSSWENLHSSFRAELLEEGVALQVDLESARNRRPFETFDVAAPALIGHGSHTREPYRRAAEELAAELPTAELVVIPGAGHGAHRSHADAFARFVTNVSHRGA
ncbi:MAG: alpha/beta fold hydrolase [Acidimicrobiales bacterium]